MRNARGGAEHRSWYRPLFVKLKSIQVQLNTLMLLQLIILLKIIVVDKYNKSNILERLIDMLEEQERREGKILDSITRNSRQL
jgi:hypothetical protein